MIMRYPEAQTIPFPDIPPCKRSTLRNGYGTLYIYSLPLTTKKLFRTMNCLFHRDLPMGIPGEGIRLQGPSLILMYRPLCTPGHKAFLHQAKVNHPWDKSEPTLYPGLDAVPSSWAPDSALSSYMTPRGAWMSKSLRTPQSWPPPGDP